MEDDKMYEDVSKEEQKKAIAQNAKTTLHREIACPLYSSFQKPQEPPGAGTKKETVLLHPGIIKKAHLKDADCMSLTSSLTPSLESTDPNHPPTSSIDSSKSLYNKKSVHITDVKSLNSFEAFTINSDEGSKKPEVAVRRSKEPRIHESEPHVQIIQVSTATQCSNATFGSGDPIDGRKTITLIAADYYWFQKGSFWLLLLALLLLFIIICLIIYFLSVCKNDSKDKKSSRTSREAQAKVDDLLPPSPFEQLSHDVEPLHYFIYLIFYVRNNFSIKGYEVISIAVKNTTNFIKLNAVDLSLESQPLIEGSTNLVVTDHKFDAKKELLILDFNIPIEPGIYNLSFNFISTNRTRQRGWYMGSYFNNNHERVFGLTVLEPIDARGMFPCFDDPVFKSNFSINLAHNEQYTTISNMNPISKNLQQNFRAVPAEGFYWDSYHSSPLMPTYLVAIALFHSNDYINVTANMVTVIARNKFISQCSYVLELTPKVIDLFETYLNIKFPLPQLDIIGIPNFDVGGMENWGLISLSSNESILWQKSFQFICTFAIVVRESNMFYVEGESPLSRQLQISSTITRELAHQWFGGLVGIRSWKDFWLNEGLVNYLHNIILDQLHPDWEMTSQFIVDDLQQTMEFDSLLNSHSIYTKLENPIEIFALFDQVSFSKSAALLRMVAHFISPTTFQKGLSIFFNQYEFSTVDDIDLWEVLTQQARQEAQPIMNNDLKNIMEPWLSQPGYPLITLIRNFNTSSAIITQEHFITNSNNSFYDKDQKWMIPITVATESKDFEITLPKLWMYLQKTIRIGQFQSKKWIILNVQSTGYYRVNYDPKNWRLIVKQLLENHEEIHYLNRAQLIDDVFHLAQANKVGYRLAFDLTEYCTNETEYIPWRSLFNNFDFIDMMLRAESNYSVFKKYVLDLMTKIYEKDTGSLSIRFKRDESEDKLLITEKFRIMLKSWACRYEERKCGRYARERFKKFKQTESDQQNPIPVEDRGVVYCTAIRDGSSDEWEFLWNYYLNHIECLSDKEAILAGLACSRDVATLHKYMWLCVSLKSIQRYETMVIFAALSKNVNAHRSTMLFLTSNWKTIKQRFKSDSLLLRLIKIVFQYANTKEDLEAFQKWKGRFSKSFGIAAQVLSTVEEIINNNIYFMQKFKWQIITRIENRRIDHENTELQESESIDEPQSEILINKYEQVDEIESVDEALAKRNEESERPGSDTV